MQMISGKYANARAFWLSRALRIYIPYFAALFLSLLCAAALWKLEGELGPCSGFGSAPLTRNTLCGLIAATITNITILGQDLALFVTADAGAGFGFTYDFHAIPSPLHHYILIPQAWTIGLELYFYALVPYLATSSTRLLWCILGSSLTLRILGYSLLSLTNDPWLYRFFPFEISLFVAGMLVWRHSESRLSRFEIKWSTTKYIAFIATATLLFWITRKIVSFGFRFFSYEFLVQVSYIMWLVLVPLLFQITKKHRFDRFLGELSYPIYLLHMAVIPFAAMLCRRQPSLNFSLTATGLTIFLSVVFVVFLIRPLDAMRARLHNITKVAAVDPFVAETNQQPDSEAP